MEHRINLDYLYEVTGGDKDIMIEMIDIFLSETQAVLSAIEQCFQDKEWTQLASETHKLKPTLMYVGLHEIHGIAEKLEQNAKLGKEVDQYGEWVDQIRSSFEAIKPQLADEKDKLLNS